MSAADSKSGANANAGGHRTVDLRVPEALPERLPVLPLRQGVVLPGGIGPLSVGRPGSLQAVELAGRTSADDPAAGLVLIAVQREPNDRPAPSDLLPVAVLARIIEAGRPAGRPPFVVVAGLARVRLLGVDADGVGLFASFEVDDRALNAELPAAAGALSALRAELGALAELLEEPGPLRALLAAPLPAQLFVDAVAGLIPSGVQEKLEVLLTADPLLRAERVLRQLTVAREAAEAERSVRDRVQSDTRGVHKEALLRSQLKAIQEELGEGDPRVGDLEKRLIALPLPPEARKVVDRELSRLPRLREGSPERSVAVDWLEWVADLPWGQHKAADRVDLSALEAALDASHHGLQDVKRQVVEHLAVRQLSGSGRADVLLLVGPPGVGKTSVGEAIAAATGRPLVRIALGGVRDEAELRGHRRTYVGSRPGRIIEGLRRAGADDPVVLLDEIDKLGAGWQGDPGAALLELLDPEQNHAFTDHYLELPFDLSRVLFIATANDLSRVPGPLRDRMEVLSIDGYTLAEKLQITRDHLLPRLAKNAGVDVADVVFTDAALEAAVLGWTREAGLRGLQRALGRVYRAAAVQKAKGTMTGPLSVDEGDLAALLGRRRFRPADRAEAAHRPGIATGLAWTPVGGDVLYVEAATLPGAGRLVLTGQLGDVMKESARAALTFALSHAAALGIDAAAAEKLDVHIHVPAGAVPKDGPSAGVTMFTALVSLLSGRSVRADVAMTGEATLRGRVLPVGGIRSKLLAACQHGVKRVILPAGNADDLEDLPEHVRQQLEIVLVDDMTAALAAALVPVEAEGLGGAPLEDQLPVAQVG